MGNFAHEIAVAEQLALLAGEKILAMRGHVATRYKTSPTDPVTEADEIADALIVAGLKKEFPNDTVISEESFKADDLSDPQRTWFVDPIDGTADFVAMGEDFSVMVGLSIHHKPVMGVVYQPTTGILWRGDCIAHKAERVEKGRSVIMDVSKKSLTDQGPIIVLSKHHASPHIEKIAKQVGVSQLIIKGSIGLRGAFIAEGLGDVYITKTSKVKLWDTCAPHAILQAAGGYFSNIYGDELDYKSTINHQHGVIASIPACGSWLTSVRGFLTTN